MFQISLAVELTELGQQFEEQIGAAERVNMHLLQNFFRNRTLNESQVPTSVDDNTPVEVRVISRDLASFCIVALFPFGIFTPTE